MKKILILLLLPILFFNIAPAPAQTETTKLSTQPEVQNFIRSMVERHQFDGNNLAALFDSTPLLPKVIANMQHPYEEQPWYVYRDHLVNDKRVTEGLKYWQKHRRALRYAEKRYGVPASIIVAIVGIESLYGKAHLDYPVLGALMTLSFSYPPRADFFREELEQYLLLTKELGVDPRSIFGSYAGAIGLPQFMPSNYRKYAIKYHPSMSEKNGGKKLGNLTQDTDDVIVSIANFLHHYGWEKGKPIAVRAKVKGKRYKRILTQKLEPKLTITQLKKYRVTPSRKITKKHKAVLIKLRNKHGYEYWLGFNDFYVLSRYNGDKQYIMAVYQLAVKLRNNY